jgi:hypothetical protein
MIEQVLRLPDWEERLAKVIETSHETLDYGQFDCAIWAARCVNAVWGIDFAGQYIGRYSAIAGGLRLARAKSLSALVSDRMRPVAPFLAHRGAIGLWQADKANQGLSVNDGVYWLAPMAGTIVQVQASFITKAWTLD